MGLFSHLAEESGGGATWWVSSKKDERWNASGRCSAGLLTMESKARHHIEHMKTLLGEPPDDLEMGGMKD